MYAIQYYLQDGQRGYLCTKKNGEFRIDYSIKNLTEFEDKYEAIDAACETSKKIFEKVIEYDLLWKP